MPGSINGAALNGNGRARPDGDNRPIRVAVAGLGRSGWNIHIKTLMTMPDRFSVTAVADPDPARRAEATRSLRCAAYETYEELLAWGGFDAVVIATPNHLHAQHTLDAIAGGFHCVVEKPFALDVPDADEMIAAAQARGVVLAPFQNRRYEHHFLKVKELIDAGAFGDVLQIRMCWHQFTRRWDWQTQKRFGGGALQNNGTHLLDQALALFGPAEPEVWVDLKRGLTTGDADEHMKLVLHRPGSPTIDIELTNACAYPQDRWHIMGTAGGLRGTMERLEWRTVDWSKMPPRPLDLGPAADRRYNSEEIIWSSKTWQQPEDATHPYELFYDDVESAVRVGGPLRVTPRSVRRYVEVLDRCRALVESHVQNASR